MIDTIKSQPYYRQYLSISCYRKTQNTLTQSLYMKKALSLVVTLLLLTGAASIRLDHQENGLHLAQEEAKAISWKNVDVSQLNEEEKRVDSVLEKLLKTRLQGFKLSTVQVANDDVTNFRFNYTNTDKNDVSITGTDYKLTIKFTDPEGRVYTYKVTTQKNAEGKDINLTAITESYEKKKQGKNSFWQSSSYSSKTYTS